MLREVDSKQPALLDGAERVFQFGRASITSDGAVSLQYRLGNGIEFVERIQIPLEEELSQEAQTRVLPLVRLLHWVAGVSYYKVAPAAELEFEFENDIPGARQAELIAALYSEGLGEFAYTNDLPGLPNPRFRIAPTVSKNVSPPASDAPSLVCVGGGKDSVVAATAVRATGLPSSLFSVGDSDPTSRTSKVMALPRLIASRSLDPALFELNEKGALNGHVPVTAIVSIIAAVAAEANGFGRVVLANERSASVGNTSRYGIDVNHQFSKGERCEQLIRSAIAETGSGVGYFSILRGASELLIARAFAGMPEYHDAFTSCNTVFRIDSSRRNSSWCCECPKCRFVFVALAPFMARSDLVRIFGRDLLDEPEQFQDFALLADVDGFKPFECVGESSEVIAAFALLAADPQWSEAAVVKRFASQILNADVTTQRDPSAELTWISKQSIPAEYEAAARQVLRA